MKERPILFQGAMVRAILNGSKTQTRRLVKHPAKDGEHGWHPIPTGMQYLPGGSARPVNPYGLPGDRLWVREAWASVVDGPYLPEHYIYRADGNSDWAHGWKPSIHMPRVACRLVLEVTEVRVERLQEISEADAIDVGIENDPRLDPAGTCHWRVYGAAQSTGRNCPERSYASLWESINGPGSWDLNHWVWVVGFRRQP